MAAAYSRGRSFKSPNITVVKFNFTAEELEEKYGEEKEAEDFNIKYSELSPECLNVKFEDYRIRVDKEYSDLNISLNLNIFK